WADFRVFTTPLFRVVPWIPWRMKSFIPKIHFSLPASPWRKRIPPGSDAQPAEHHRELRVGDDHQKDRLHHGDGRVPSHAGRAALDPEALEAADQRDDQREHRR